MAGRPPINQVSVIAAAVLVVGIGAVAGAVLVGYLSNGAGGLDEPDAHAAAGLQQLVDDVEGRTRDSEVFRAVIYPRYASLDLPVDARSQRSETVYWDGDLDDPSSRSTSGSTRFDLGEVQAEPMVATIETAKGLVEEPDTWYVVVNGPSTSYDDGDPPSITAIATNEFGESAYVEVAFDGTEVRRTVPEPT